MNKTKEMLLRWDELTEIAMKRPLTDAEQAENDYIFNEMDWSTCDRCEGTGETYNGHRYNECSKCASKGILTQ
jgi:DnaJ-class molecular chaperone